MAYTRVQDGWILWIRGRIISGGWRKRSWTETGRGGFLSRTYDYFDYDWRSALVCFQVSKVKYSRLPGDAGRFEWPRGEYRWGIDLDVFAFTRCMYGGWVTFNLKSADRPHFLKKISDRVILRGTNNQLSFPLPLSPLSLTTWRINYGLRYEIYRIYEIFFFFFCRKFFIKVRNAIFVEEYSSSPSFFFFFTFLCVNVYAMWRFWWTKRNVREL